MMQPGENNENPNFRPNLPPPHPPNFLFLGFTSTSG